eukprot:55620_1
MAQGLHTPLVHCECDHGRWNLPRQVGRQPRPCHAWPPRSQFFGALDKQAMLVAPPTGLARGQQLLSQTGSDDLMGVPHGARNKLRHGRGAEDGANPCGKLELPRAVGRGGHAAESVLEGIVQQPITDRFAHADEAGGKARVEAWDASGREDVAGRLADTGGFGLSCFRNGNRLKLLAGPNDPKGVCDDVRNQPSSHGGCGRYLQRGVLPEVAGEHFARLADDSEIQPARSEDGHQGARDTTEQAPHPCAVGTKELPGEPALGEGALHAGLHHVQGVEDDGGRRPAKASCDCMLVDGQGRTHPASVGPEGRAAAGLSLGDCHFGRKREDEGGRANTDAAE